jgi:hypothetical protein
MIYTEAQAIAILNRMGIDYSTDDVADVMSGESWVPVTDADWRRWHRGV